MRKDAATIAREVLDGNLYMTLATADAAGRPWATPVFFTADGPTRFYWVSSPDARHSRNIAERPEVGIVVFDSQVAVGAAEAVYMTATAAGRRRRARGLRRALQLTSGGDGGARR